MIPSYAGYMGQGKEGKYGGMKDMGWLDSGIKKCGVVLEPRIKYEVGQLRVITCWWNMWNIFWIIIFACYQVKLKY